MNTENLPKNIVAIDIETTGLDKAKDRILQLSMIKFDSKSGEILNKWDEYILPSGEFEITKEAQEKHGLSKEFILENGKSLKSVYDSFIKFINKDDAILTFNGTSFDIPFIYTDFMRDGLDPMIMEHKLLDSFLIEKKIHPCTLEALFERYSNKDAKDSHNSLYDCYMTKVVFMSQMQSELEDTELFEEMDFPEKILARDSKNNIYLTSGKHKNESVLNLCLSDPSYIKWLFENVLSQYSKNIIMKEYKSILKK